ncbi:hypothetical protein HPB47_009716 [Ixodes persulcatus]|uniref:Uncharacterized protein n=1 Tax=Ixodes persulcatus TaxID=34615 RepID=A0AC60P1E9_IXOPE|nr:hypothetical protein HPB47_009716 [Ixodes persulcatus]
MHDRTPVRCSSKSKRAGVGIEPSIPGFRSASFHSPRLAMRAFPVSGEKGILVVEPSPGEAFASVAGLMLHRHEHQGEPWYFCDRCRRYFCDFGGYAQHAKGHMDAWKRACLPFFAFRLWLKKRS